jgi:hypothetical protein
MNGVTYLPPLSDVARLSLSIGRLFMESDHIPYGWFVFARAWPAVRSDGYSESIGPLSFP